MDLLTTNLNRLLERVDAVDALISRAKSPKEIGAYARTDVDDIVDELLVLAQNAINLGDLELRIIAQKAIDFDTLVRLRELLGALQLPASVNVSPQLTINVPDTLDKLQLAIEDLRSAIPKKSPLEIRVDVEMKIGAPVRHLLIAAAKSQLHTDDIERLVEAKVALLADSQLQKAWAAVQAELDSPDLASLVGPEGVISIGWRNFDSPESVRRKYAAYVVSLKWKMMSMLQQRGVNAFPVDVHEVANIASWKDRSASERITAQESAFQKSLARIAECCYSLFNRTTEDFANALQVAEDSPLIKVERGLFEKVPQEEKNFVALVYEIRKLINLVDAFLVPEAQIEKALRQYKLGLEVTAPESASLIHRRKEVRLQRELSRFLIERGIYAVGTQFGRAETDLVSNERSDYFILEVKKYPRGRGVTPRNINAAVVQLQSYMDQHPTHPRGILVVYNLSETLLVAPQKWLRGKYWVVAVNLGGKSPSHRLKSISIEEGAGDSTISVHWV